MSFVKQSVDCTLCVERISCRVNVLVIEQLVNVTLLERMQASVTKAADAVSFFRQSTVMLMDEQKLYPGKV